MIAPIVLLAAIAGVATAQNSSTTYTSPYTVDPGTVDMSMKVTWCQNQQTSCLDICNSRTNVNSCDPQSLSWTCTCSSSTTPNVSSFMQTIPFFECQQWQANCQVQNTNNAAVQQACLGVDCGTNDPTKLAAGGGSGSSSSGSMSGGSSATSAAGGAASTATSGAGGVASTVTSGAGGVASTVTSGAGGVASTVTSGAGGVASTVTSGAAGAAGTVTSAAGAAGSAITSAAGAVTSKVGGSGAAATAVPVLGAAGIAALIGLAL